MTPPIWQKMKLNVIFLQRFCLNLVFPMWTAKKLLAEKWEIFVSLFSVSWKCWGICCICICICLCWGICICLLLEVLRYLGKWLLESFTHSTNILRNDSAQGALHSQAGMWFSRDKIQISFIISFSRIAIFVLQG